MPPLTTICFIIIMITVVLKSQSVAADGDYDNDGDDALASSLTSSLPYLPHKYEKARSRRVRATQARDTSEDRSRSAPKHHVPASSTSLLPAPSGHPLLAQSSVLQ